MPKNKKTLLKVYLYLQYYKDENILDRYTQILNNIVMDNDCLDILDNPNEQLYITPLSKVTKNKIREGGLNQNE